MTGSWGSGVGFSLPAGPQVISARGAIGGGIGAWRAGSRLDQRLDQRLELPMSQRVLTNLDLALVGERIRSADCPNVATVSVKLPLWSLFCGSRPSPILILEH